MHNGLAKTGFAARSSTRSSFSRPRSATLMHFNTRSRTFQLLVVLYGKISRMRVDFISSHFFAAAEQVLRRIVDVYFKPPVRIQLHSASVDAPRWISRCPSGFQPML